jgi:rhodanese-related sulfurtransferase
MAFNPRHHFSTDKTSQSRIRLVLLVCSIIMTGAQPVHANEDAPPDAPESIDGVTIVDAEGLIEKLMSIPDLVLIDSRITTDRKQGFIEGSISLPDIETTCDTLGGVVESKSTPLMFYCNGVKCGRSAKAAQIAVDCDYTNLYWFRNGMEEWKANDYPLVK